MPSTPLAEPTAAPKPIENAEVARLMHILVVDDSELDRQRVLRLCSRAGLRFEAAEAGSLEEMSTAMDDQAFDLVFIDYLLAGETGIEALDLLMSHPDQGSAAAVMIAGEGRIDIAVDAMRKGCSDYVVKSQLTVETIQKSVATAIERSLLNKIIARERMARAELEQAVQSYANSCTASMRSILSATLRRVRNLRNYASPQLKEYGRELGLLEMDIERLWDALPNFRDAALRDATTKPQIAVIDQPAEPTRH